MTADAASKQRVTPFDTVVVVGVGLIGGSIASAAKERNLAHRVLGVDPDPDTRSWAVEHGVVDEALDTTAAFKAGWFSPGGADLVVLATPAIAAVDWLARLGEHGYEGVITDAASTKTAVVNAASTYLSAKAVFIGGHPMAGSERSGVRASSPELFDGAYYVLTPTERTDVAAYGKLHAFVTGLGARVVSVEARLHDDAVAIVSHVPHVTAAALINLAASRTANGEDLLRLAAGGFKDMTRIAAGSAELWTGICLDNADPLITGIDSFIDELAVFCGYLIERNRPGVRAWLAAAAEVRRELPAQWVPLTTALTELVIPMVDKPGVVSEITLAVGRAGCNIEDIEIEHQTEDRAFLRLVLTDEGDLKQLLDSLTSLGYEPTANPL